jgi:UDPglucose 6-dehydrogenase
MLQARDATIKARDPQGREKGEELLPGIEWCGNALEAANDADVLVVLTEWNEFRAADLKQLRAAMRGDVLVDLRNVYQPALAEEAGFIYCGVGRGKRGQGANGAAQAYNEKAVHQNGLAPRSSL